MKYQSILEEETKNKVAQDFFSKFDCTKILGKIDFAVKVNKGACPLVKEDEYLLWAEAKQKPTNVFEMLAQLVLTIGKARTFNEILPPSFLGCFDNKKIAFIPYSEIQDIFYQNDFNWKVAPSNADTKEFKQILDTLQKSLKNDTLYVFNFEKDEADLRRFIRENFVVGKTETSLIQIDKNNFITIYQKWLDAVKPTIAVNWDKVKKRGLMSGHFYLADLLSRKNETIQEKLFVLLKSNYYEADRRTDDDEIFSISTFQFNDNQKAHTQFWAKYARPPLEEYWDFIIKRQDLLVPQDIREIKGSFFTPPEWVELSQRYLADVFGVDWQDEYYVWDCCAGTGNLLAGLVNKDNLWASTLDKQDVDVMHQRIQNGANLWANQVFQFDFLNDAFLPKSKGGKLPDELFGIISDEKKRKKLLIYINPPYVEATSTTAVFVQREHKTGVSFTKMRDKYKDLIGGKATREISVHFMARIYNEIPHCKLALFSKVKFVCSENFIKFRQFFKADFKKGFAVKSDTFENVPGKFPISFTIWDLDGKKFPEFIKVDIPEENTKKKFYDGFRKSINQWIKNYNEKKSDNSIGFMECLAPDFQRLHFPYITKKRGTVNCLHFAFSITNLIEGCIYFAVRTCIQPTWLNDRDQFYYPNDDWKDDIEFHNDCLAFTLFHSQNRTTVKDGVNHWIPFVETEVNAHYKFESHVMTNFINGERKQNGYIDLFKETACIKRKFSKEAQTVFDAGRELWKYYHNAFDNSNRVLNPVRVGYNVNASLYDIREYFQGRNEKGKMNNNSTDLKYNELSENLRDALKFLAQKIEPKVYEYGFLKK